MAAVSYTTIALCTLVWWQQLVLSCLSRLDGDQAQVTAEVFVHRQKDAAVARAVDHHSDEVVSTCDELFPVFVCAEQLELLIDTLTDVVLEPVANSLDLADLGRRHCWTVYDSTSPHGSVSASGCKFSVGTSLREFLGRNV